MSEELFESAVRGKGDLAGVFEYDGETGYFYLYEVGRDDQHQIVDSIHVLSGATDLGESDIRIIWDDRENRVALFLVGVQWAVFNIETGRKFGGDYLRDSLPTIPPEESVVDSPNHDGQRESS